MQALKARLVQPHALVDLQDVAELKGVTDGGVRIGAMTRYVELAGEKRLAPAYAALIDAARTWAIARSQSRHHRRQRVLELHRRLHAGGRAHARCHHEPGLERRRAQRAGAGVHRRAARDGAPR